MIPRPATRRVSDRRARAMGAMAARARGAFPFPARPDSPRVSQHLPHAPAGRGILFQARAFASSVPFGRTRRASSSTALAGNALMCGNNQSKKLGASRRGGFFFGPRHGATRDGRAGLPPSGGVAGSLPFRRVAPGGGTATRQPEMRDGSERRAGASSRPEAGARGATVPREVAGETSRGGGRMPSTPRRSPGERLSPLGLGTVRGWGFRRGATRRTDGGPERRATSSTPNAE